MKNTSEDTAETFKRLDRIAWGKETANSGRGVPAAGYIAEAKAAEARGRKLMAGITPEIERGRKIMSGVTPEVERGRRIIANGDFEAVDRGRAAMRAIKEADAERKGIRTFPPARSLHKP